MRFGLIVLTCLFILTLLVQGSSLQLSALTESPYKLSYPAGKEYIVTQGNNSPGGSHSKEVDPKAIFAFDFGMLGGDPIAASRSGKVLAVQDNFQSGKCDPSYYNKANYIVIDHGDGTSALYLHLKYKSVKVNEGEWVEQGQIIAEADATGYVCGITGNHLHFQVQETPKDRNHWYTQSIPISFADKDALTKEPDGIPKEGNKYVSDNTFAKSVSCVSKIAYTAPIEPGGYSGIWFVNEDGTGKELFRENAHSPAWSPDGKRIAYVRYLLDEEERFCIGEEIRVATSDGLSDQMVFTTEKLSETESPMPVLLHWAPDGKGIFFQFALWQTDAGVGSVLFLDLSTLQIKKLDLPCSVGLLGRSYDIRGSDEKIVYIKEQKEGIGKLHDTLWGETYDKYCCQSWIMVADKDGKSQHPVFGPIERELAFGIDTEYGRGYFIPSTLEYPRWSSDGNKIAFLLIEYEIESVEDYPDYPIWKENVLATIDIDDSKGGNFKVLYQTNESYIRDITWSPDGKKIAIVDKWGWILIINSDGLGNPQRLVEGYEPSWALVPINP